MEPALRTDSVKAGVNINLPTISSGLHFLQKGFEPQDADLKIGPFFFKLRAIAGAVLHSDNIFQTPDDQRESGTIAIATATVNIVAQLTETLRLATSGSFVYLPLEGKAGIAGFGLTDAYSFGLFAGPSTRAQVAWDTQIGGWHVVFLDEFTVGLGTYSDDFRGDTALFDGGLFNEESRAGRYSFHAGGGGGRRSSGSDFRHDHGDLRTDLVVYSNTISAETERLVPGSVRLRARIYHEDLWYNQGNRGLPGLREGGSILLASLRENMRFKPFVIYEAFRSDRNTGFLSIFRAGVDGPITPQLHLHAEAGYYTGGDRGAGYLWDLSLDHTVGPYTHESLTYTRTFDDFRDEITEGIGYNIRQILGPRLYGDAYVYNVDVQDAREEGVSRHELRAGVRFTLTAGPKTVIRLSANYATNAQNDGEFLTERLEIGYNLTPTLLARFAYQHQHESSNVADDNFDENLFFLSLTKYFE